MGRRKRSSSSSRDAKSPKKKDNSLRDRSSAGRHKITSYLSPKTGRKKSNEETSSKNFVCLWLVGRQEPCNYFVDSYPEMMKHIFTESNDHAKYGMTGYVCKWIGCPKRKTTHFTSKEEFEDHLREHLVGSEPNEEVDSIIDTDQSDFIDDEDNDADYKSSGDEVSESQSDNDEDFVTGKRKKKTAQRKKTAKKLRSDTTTGKSNKTTSLPVVSTGSVSKERNTTPAARVSQEVTSRPVIIPANNGLYRFTCQWEVNVENTSIRNASTSPTIVCQRKFQTPDGDGSIHHLVDHHLKKLLNGSNRPLQCSWKGCKSGEKIFDSVDELTTHVTSHAADSGIPYSNIGTIGAALAAKTTKTAQSQAQNLSLDSTKQAPSGNKSVEAPRAVSSVRKTTSQSSPNKTKTPIVDNSWIIACLRSLLQAKYENFDGTLCEPPKFCCFCRFFTLRRRLESSQRTRTYDMPEFTGIKDKFDTCNGDPMKFINKFLWDAGSHGVHHHDQCAFEVNFHTIEMDKYQKKCSKHPLNGNLINLFNVYYNDCRSCTNEAQRWPTEAQITIIIDMGKKDKFKFPDVLVVKGRIYQLVSVICQDDEGSCYTHLKIQNAWITFRNISSGSCKEDNVLKDPAARIVVYCSKDEINESMNSSCEQLDEEEPARMSDDDDDDEPAEDCTADIHDDDMNQKVVPAKEKIVPTSSPLPKPLGGKSFPSAKCEINKGFEELFTNRPLLNKDNESCMNSVLQVLLTTGIPVTVKELCRSGHWCCFCGMLSFTQRAIHTPGDRPISPFELSLMKNDLGITMEGCNPANFIKELVEKIVTDEAYYHESSDIKYKFAIRFQKESCTCMMSCEVFHWVVSPTKKNQSLFNLMADYSLKCDQCNIMTTVRPIQMPENLIITIQRKGKLDEASVHFPDEWALHNTRYFLSAVVVANSSEDDLQRYFAYCKVFGKWVKYEDDIISKASSCDVLGLKDACVLVYVENELTAETVKKALEQAKELVDKKKELKEIMVKEERPDS